MYHLTTYSDTKAFVNKTIAAMAVAVAAVAAILISLSVKRKLRGKMAQAESTAFSAADDYNEVLDDEESTDEEIEEARKEMEAATASQYRLNMLSAKIGVSQYYSGDGESIMGRVQSLLGDRDSASTSDTYIPNPNSDDMIYIIKQLIKRS